jgi:hypothetical protein
MKKILSNAGLLCLFILISCHQEILEQQPVPPISGEAGSADFTKFVSIGNSLTAGYQAGALFQVGQDNSYPNIMAEQFAYVSENDQFDQPDTNSENGCFNPTGGCTRGRLILFDADGAGTAATPAPAPAGTPTMPAPYNTGPADHGLSLAPYPNDKKAALNNFGVPGIILAQILTPATGGPAISGNPAYNPYYRRFASNPSNDGATGSTILGDALAAQPTFFSFWLGNNDVLGYATSGGSGAIPMTSAAAFEGYYETAINTILGSNDDLKGVVGNIPDITTIPFFKTVAWNVVKLDAATAGALTTQLANNYNGFLSVMVTNTLITEAEKTKRLLAYTAGSNGILITDETLTDLSPYMVGPAAALLPYAKARQATIADLVCLTAGGYLGRPVDITGDGIPDGVNGVSIPLINSTSATTMAAKGDDLILLPTEITAIQERIVAFNAIISSVVDGSGGRLALADINTKFANVFNRVTTSVDGLPVNATFAPPSGLFSEDGVHPNNRGSAYIAKAFIEAINAKFGATVPLPNIARKHSTGLPVFPNP